MNDGVSVVRGGLDKGTGARSGGGDLEPCFPLIAFEICVRLHRNIELEGNAYTRSADNYAIN